MPDELRPHTKLLYFNRYPLPIWYQIAMGVCEITDGLTRLLTLGYLTTLLSFELCFWYALREAKRLGHFKD